MFIDLSHYSCITILNDISEHTLDDSTTNIKEDDDWIYDDEYAIGSQGEKLIYCVHPLDSPFQDWNLDKGMTTNGKSEFTCPVLIAFYVEKIRFMAMETRKMILKGKLKVDIEIYLNSPFIIMTPEKKFKKNNFDLIMMGNMCDRKGLFEIMNQSCKLLKFTSDNPMAHILSYHRTCHIQDMLYNSNEIMTTSLGQFRHRNPITCYDGNHYELVPKVENHEENDNFASELFCMKDYHLKSVRWFWKIVSSPQLINENSKEHKVSANEIKHVWNQRSEKENRNGDIHKECRTFNNTIMLEGKNNKIKTASTSFDDIEHSTNDINTILQQQKELSKINKKFSPYQNQAAHDIVHTECNKMNFSTRFLCLPYALFISIQQNQ